jgi:hypothetical protein
MLCNTRRLETLARRTMAKATTLAAAVLDTTLEESHIELPAIRRLTVTERSLDMGGRRNRRALESSRRLASTRKSVRARSTSCLTVHTLGRAKLWSCCPSTRKRGMPTRRRRNLRLWETSERRRKTEMARPRISRLRISESHVWPMPNLQDELHDLHGSNVFATLDFCQGYWQIPLQKDSQDWQSFITPDGVYTPTRVLHGTRNATQHLQSVLVVMMEDIKSNI